MSVGCCSDEFVWHQENKNTWNKSQRDVSLLKKRKKIVSRNELRETENIGATDLDELIANVLLQVHEFLFLICVKKTISMKILVLRVINSLPLKLLCTGLYSRVVCVKSPHSLVRAFTQTTSEYNPVRRTFYDVN